MAKHRAPRYVRTKKALSNVPVAAGATVVGLGVLSSPANAATTHDWTGVAPAAAAAPAADTGAQAAPEADYTVQRGDTVAEIAAAHGESWRPLYQRNLDVIGDDPDLILPGQVLATSGAAPVATQAAAQAATPATAQVATPAATPDVTPAPVVAPDPVPAPAPEVTPLPEVAPTPAAAAITNSAGAVQPRAQAAADAVVAAVPGVAGITIGGTRPSAVDPHGHPSGLALDYMVGSDAALGDAVVAYHVAHWDELGVEYVIWQQRILTSPTGAWKAMADRGSPTANHMDHPHVNYRA